MNILIILEIISREWKNKGEKVHFMLWNLQMAFRLDLFRRSKNRHIRYECFAISFLYWMDYDRIWNIKIKSDYSFSSESSLYTIYHLCFPFPGEISGWVSRKSPLRDTRAEITAELLENHLWGTLAEKSQAECLENHLCGTLVQKSQAECLDNQFCGTLALKSRPECLDNHLCGTLALKSQAEWNFLGEAF